MIRRVLEPFKTSVNTHLARPVLVLYVLSMSIIFFGFGRLTGSDPGAAELGQAFAPAPLDAFGDLRLLPTSLLDWRAPVLFVMRVAFVAGYLSLLLGPPLRRRNLARLAVTYLGAYIAVIVPLGASVAFLGLISAEAGTARSIGVIVSLLLLPVLLAALAALFTPMAVRALIGDRIRPLLNNPAVWVMSAMAAWLYLFTSHRIGELDEAAQGSAATPYFFALSTLLVESIIFGAIAFATSAVIEKTSGTPPQPPELDPGEPSVPHDSRSVPG